MQEQAKQETYYTPARDERGRLLPGYTANPHGRPKHSQDRYNKKTLKALSRFVDNPERMQEMLQECWEEDKIKTMGMILGARTKDVNFREEQRQIVEINFLGFEEDGLVECVDGEFIEVGTQTDLPPNEHDFVVYSIE